MSDVDATTQQEPAQNDGYEPYGTMEVVPTLYRPTSSVAPQECPTILQVLWHRRSAATILQVLWHYGGAGSARETTEEGGIKGDH